MGTIKEAMEKLKYMGGIAALNISHQYTTIIYCNSCGDRVGRVRPGTDRIDIFCIPCCEAADVMMKVKTKPEGEKP